jgi:hypothetical protein
MVGRMGPLIALSSSAIALKKKLFAPFVAASLESCMIHEGAYREKE